jgi:hypothetical protein
MAATRQNLMKMSPFDPAWGLFIQKSTIIDFEQSAQNEVTERDFMENEE